MYTIRFPLGMSPQQRWVADKRFFHMFRIHNQIIKHAIKLMNILNNSPEYHALKKQYALNLASESEKKVATSRMNQFRKEIGLTKYGLESYIKVMGQSIRRFVSSNQVQKEADRIWPAVEKMLFGNGKKIHFKKLADIRSISSKNMNGCVYTDPFHPDSRKTARPAVFPYQIDWLGMILKVKVNKKDPYVRMALGLDSATPVDIRYCEIVRLMFNSGWRYYVNLVIRGDPPQKTALGQDIVGIDPGVSTVAYASDNALGLEELAPRCHQYTREIRLLQNRMEKSRRITNPDNYNTDGTVKKGKKKWNLSHNYCRMKRKLQTQFRKKSAYTRSKHSELANHIMEIAGTIIIEPNQFSKMAKKEPAEREKKELPIEKKGRTIMIRKYRKTRRFGRSINNRSPGQFVSILKNKILSHGGEWYEIDPFIVKASQYCHDTGQCHKIPLSQRRKMISGSMVLRDLYSAFIIRNTDPQTNNTNAQECSNKFSHFLWLQEQLINRIQPIPHPACFGI